MAGATTRRVARFPWRKHRDTGLRMVLEAEMKDGLGSRVFHLGQSTTAEPDLTATNGVFLSGLVGLMIAFPAAAFRSVKS